MTESQIQKQCLQYIDQLEKEGAPIRRHKAHGNGYTAAGTPDVHVTYRGQSYWIEIKRTSGRATRLQRHHLKFWEQAGAITGVATSLEEFLAILGIEPKRSP